MLHTDNTSLYVQRKRQKVLGPQDGVHTTSHNTARGHVGAVTSRQRYVTSLMDSSEVRLPNPWKTKVLVSQAGQDVNNSRAGGEILPSLRHTSSSPLMGY